MDFIVRLPCTHKGHDVIWVVVDRLTKMARFIGIKITITTSKLVDQFFDELFWFYGLLMDIVSERDWKFTSYFWTWDFNKLQTILSMSSTIHPQSDKQIEWVNQITEAMIWAYVLVKPTKFS